MTDLSAISTIDDFLSKGWYLIAFCERPDGCGRWSDVDLVALREVLGGGFDLYRGRGFLIRRLKCKVCGSKHIVLQVSNDAARRCGPGGSHGLSL